MRLLCRTCDYVFVHPASYQREHKGHEFMTFKAYAQEVGKLQAEATYQEWKRTGKQITRSERIKQEQERRSSYSPTTAIQKPAKQKQLSWLARWWTRRVGK